MGIIQKTSHRPFPLRSKHWIMRQKWSNVLFAHWPIEPELLRAHIPSPIEIDIFDGVAWLGVIIFKIDGIYPRGLPPFSVRTPFPEINLRTYVKLNGRPGIYFLSLDVDDWTSYTLAKRWLHVPYQPANISFHQKGEAFHFESIRKGNDPVVCKGVYTPESDIFYPRSNTLDHWLAERYCFYSEDEQSNIYCLDIHHHPWPLQKADAHLSTNELFTSFNFELIEETPISHYSQGVEALIWNIKKM